MPWSFYCNEFLVKKQREKFLTIRECIHKYGADATRFTLALTGDGLDDTFFEESVADSIILKLYNLEKWIID